MSAAGLPSLVRGTLPARKLLLEWNSANASWVVGGSPPQVTGTKVVPVEKVLGSAESDASGSFSVQITVPPDFGMQHVMQAYYTNGTALAPKATYTLEPQFSVSPTSGPAGTPITVTGTGLGDGLYSTNYHVYWDNNYVGYATALTTGGSTNFTIYASGVPGTHYLAVYQGYPGPGYLNAEQIPVASQGQSYYPPGCVVMTSCAIPYYVNFTVTSAYSQTTTSGSSGSLAISGLAAIVPLLAAVIVPVSGGLYLSRQDAERRRAIARSTAAILVVVLVAVAGVALYSALAQGSSSQTTTSSLSSSSSGPPPSFAACSGATRLRTAGFGSRRLAVSLE